MATTAMESTKVDHPAPVSLKAIGHLGNSSLKSFSIMDRIAKIPALLLACLACCSPIRAEEPEPPCRDVSASVCKYPWGDYVIEIQLLPMEATSSENVHIAFSRHGDTELRLDTRVGAGLLAPHEESMDLNGDGLPEAVIWVFSGGAHCCYEAYVYSLAKQCQLLARIDCPDYNDGVVIGNLDGDPVGEIQSAEDAGGFEHGITYGVGHRNFNVVLEFTGPKLHLAVDAMRKPRPTGEELQKFAEQFEGWDPVTGTAVADWNYPADLLASACDLVYSGNGNVALKLLRDSFKDFTKQRNEFCLEYLSNLSRRPYWPEVQAMNGWTGMTPKAIWARQ